MMTLRQFVKNAEAVVGQQKMNMAVKLQKGQVPNMETYHREVGRSEGMDLAMSVLRDMVQQMEDAERDESLPEMPGGQS